MPKKWLTAGLLCLLLCLPVLCAHAEMVAKPQEPPKMWITPTDGTAIYNEYMTLHLHFADGLKPKKVTWRSSKRSLALVSDKGKVKGKGTGTVTITAEAVMEDGSKLQASVPVNCVVPITSFEMVTKKGARLAVGKTLRVRYRLRPTTSTNKRIAWRSSDDAVAAVDANGLVYGISPGQATITGSTTDGTYRVISVRVNVR